jgi:hypothetical protein
VVIHPLHQSQSVRAALDVSVRTRAPEGVRAVHLSDSTRPTLGVLLSAVCDSAPTKKIAATVGSRSERKVEQLRWSHSRAASLVANHYCPPREPCPRELVVVRRPVTSLPVPRCLVLGRPLLVHGRRLGLHARADVVRDRVRARCLVLPLRPNALRGPVGRHLRLVLALGAAVAPSLAHAVLGVRGRVQLVRRVRARSLVDVGARVLYVPLDTSPGHFKKSPWLSAVLDGHLPPDHTVQRAHPRSEVAVGADFSYPPSSHIGVASQHMY